MAGKIYAFYTYVSLTIIRSFNFTGEWNCWEQKRIIQNCFPGSNVIERDDENNCRIAKERLQKSAWESYLNIAAFISLVIGYFLASFSLSPSLPGICTMLGTMITTTVLLLCECFLCRCIAKAVYAKDIIIEYDELEKMGVDTVITDKEIDDMFGM